MKTYYIFYKTEDGDEFRADVAFTTLEDTLKRIEHYIELDKIGGFKNKYYVAIFEPYREVIA